MTYSGRYFNYNLNCPKTLKLNVIVVLINWVIVIIIINNIVYVYSDNKL